MSEYASATIVLRRHDGSSVEVDIPHGNYVDAKGEALICFDVPFRLGEPDLRRIDNRAIEITIRAELSLSGPGVLATQTVHPAEEPR